MKLYTLGTYESMFIHYLSVNTYYEHLLVNYCNGVMVFNIGIVITITVNGNLCIASNY